MRALVFLWRVLLMAPVSLVCTLAAVSAAIPSPRWRPELMCLAVAASVVVWSLAHLADAAELFAALGPRTGGCVWLNFMRTLKHRWRAATQPDGTIQVMVSVRRPR